MPVEGPKPTKFHSNRRRELLALADVAIYQAQVIDKNGQERVVAVWHCGPDILVGENMDALFDRERRKAAPRWMLDQLPKLPPSRRFDYLGNPKSGAPPAPAPVEDVEEEDDSLPGDDDDAVGVESA